MKKSIIAALMLAVTIGIVSTYAATPKKSTTTAIAPKVEVYYFHFTRRCVTCQAVETETQKAIVSLYPAQYKSGNITFKSVNLDENDSKSLAEKCKAEGQQLLILSANKRTDLTDQAFMYAKSNPEKLKNALKNAIDPVLNK